MSDSCPNYTQLQFGATLHNLYLHHMNLISSDILFTSLGEFLVTDRPFISALTQFRQQGKASIDQEVDLFDR